MMATEVIQPHVVSNHANCGMVNPRKSLDDPALDP
jgi:hypothetical protein